MNELYLCWIPAHGFTEEFAALVPGCSHSEAAENHAMITDAGSLEVSPELFVMVRVADGREPARRYMVLGREKRVYESTEVR